MALRRSLAPPALLACLVAAALALAACGEDEEEEAAVVEEPTGCPDVDPSPPRPVNLKRPKDLKPPPAGTRALVKTSCGKFEILLDVKRAPKTSASFAHLVRERIYDNSSFHRIVPGFVIQGGDPKGDGTGGPGYSVDEPPPRGLSYTRDTVAMAKSGADPPGRSGSQFFVVTAADAGLPTEYALLGEVTAGRKVVEAIEELGNPATEAPVRPVVIESIRLSGE